MAVEIFPRIAGLKVESPWPETVDATVRCTVRLTRPLTRAEADRLGRLLPVDVASDGIHYQCPQHEVEETRDRIARALARIEDSRSGHRGRLARLMPRRWTN
jgi:hypothetical protein